MLSDKIIQDNDNNNINSYLIFDAEVVKYFHHRFVLLRGNKHTLKEIKELRPQILSDTSDVLEYWKPAHRYFLIDLLTNKCLLHCEFVKKSSKGYIKDISPFLPYLSDIKDFNSNTFEVIEKHDTIVNKNDISKINIYKRENKWFLITYNHLGTDKFIINTRSFIDFGKYFSRKYTIDRILDILNNEYE